ncbi:MAG: hypothetical protein HKN16_10130 [Saprospiraceae bacterium]|nr:hypothetical protein [Saprospiraceae bacterium]
MNVNPKVDHYLIEGCGRCPLGGTADCKVLTWTSELDYLRKLAVGTGLKEELKWSVPCYTLDGKNIMLISAFKDFAAISFFKGSLLQDKKNLLEKPGPNSQASRFFKFSSVEDIDKIKEEIEAYIYEAIEVEKAGLKVQFKKNPEPIPEELESKFEEDPVFKSAFESLTPGRQRGYILHFSQPKQSKTKIARIEKWMPKILAGDGMHDEYRRKKKKK